MMTTRSTEHSRETHEENPRTVPGSARDPEPWAGEDVLDLADVVRFFRRHLLLISGFALGAGVLAAAVLVGLISPTYQASATLVVTPPQFRSDLKPPPLSVQGYQRLLESNTVVAETMNTLIDDGVVDTEESLRVGQQIESRIFVSRRSEETALAPVIEAVAKASNPEVAATIANTWSRVFLEQVSQLIQGAVDPAYEFIRSEFDEVRRELEELEQEDTELASEYQRRIDALESSWNRRLVGHQNETEDLLAEYQTATRGRMENLASELYDRLPKAEAPSLDPSLNQLRVQLEQIVSLRTQLAQTPQLLTLEKAISDDALWEAILGKEGAPAEFQERLSSALRTQEVNPVYTDLALKLSNVELALEPLSPDLRTQVRNLASKMETIQRQRSAGLSKLIAERDQEREELERDKKREVANLRREREMVLEQIRRDIDRQESLSDTLAGEYQQAKLARSEKDLPDVRLASPAVPPSTPAPSHTLLKVLLAVLLGGVAGVIIALIRTVSNGRDRPPE